MRRFFRKLLHRRRMHRDIEQELAFHREMAQQHDNRIPLGNAAVIAEYGYDVWRFQFIENLWRDLVYGARGLRRSPLLVLTALASLGLGIGVNATMFSLGMEFLFSQPSARDASSVVSVRLAGNSHAPPPVVDFVASSGLFADVVGENEEATLNFNDGVETRPVASAFVTKNFFTALGVPMLHGRGIEPADPNEVAVVSYHFWRRQLGGDSSVVGRAINLDGRMCTVVGILPQHHRGLIGFGYSPEIYTPRYLDSTMLAIYARVKPGMSMAAARAGLLTVARRLDQQQPAPFKYAEDVEMTPVGGLARLRAERDLMGIGAFFVLLLAVTGLVLLIACVNVASLLLARASARRREMAIRVAIGAGQARLLQQLLVESLLLAILGAGSGVGLAQLSAGLLARIELPLPIPIHLQIEPDWRLAVYAMLLTTFATLACGLLPAWRALKESLAPDLHRESRTRLRRTLVAAQVAVSAIVLTTGFLFLRNLASASSMSPGFDVRHTIFANVNMPPAADPGGSRKSAYIRQVIEELQTLPGMDGVAAARVVPFNGGTRFRVDIRFADNGETRDAFFYWNAITPDYFRVMSIPLLSGRTFSDADRGERVAIVNPEFVRRYLGQRHPLGVVFLWGADGKTPYRIVGVAGVTKTLTLGEEPQPQLYEPLSQVDNSRQEIGFVLRSAVSPERQLDAVRRTLHRVDPMAGVQVETLYRSLGLAFLPSQAGAVLMGSTGLVGLLLASIGLYGVMTYSVARRTREIGIRVAIGANRSHIARMILDDAARVTLGGTVAGLLVAWFATRPLAMFLVTGLKPADPRNFAVVAAAMLLTGLAAVCGPVLRALAVDPCRTLRQQ